MGGWVGLILQEGIAEDSQREIRDRFSGMTHQATYCWTPDSSSLPLSSSSYFVLFTSTVYFYCLLLGSTSSVCMGIWYFPPPGVVDRNRVSVHSFNTGVGGIQQPALSHFEMGDAKRNPIEGLAGGRPRYGPRRSIQANFS